MKKPKKRPKPSKSRLRHRRKNFIKALMRPLMNNYFKEDIIHQIFQSVPIIEYETYLKFKESSLDELNS